jgi:glutathione S-transferase
VTNEGKHLDQNIAIHTYVADLAPGKNLMPPHGSFERAKALNWLSFVAADLHKSIGVLFSISAISEDKNVQATVRNFMLIRANECLQYLDTHLAEKDYLLGKSFTPADAYAFVVVGWTHPLKIPITSYKNIISYQARISARPAVAKVLKMEDLV